MKGFVWSWNSAETETETQMMKTEIFDEISLLMSLPTVGRRGSWVYSPKICREEGVNQVFVDASHLMQLGAHNNVDLKEIGADF